MERDNLTMLVDFYELTMGNGYFRQGLENQIAYFDLFFRKIPENGGVALCAGLGPFIDYVQNLKFTEDDLAFLQKKGFDERFIDYLRNWKFSCDIWAVPEGTPIFPGEPIMTVRGPVIQAQFIETMALLLFNHQSLIATKASRIVRAAQGRPVMEFGSRRAHGASAAIYGARSAYIGGCCGTACANCEPDYGIPALGTMAHSWVQLFDTEYEAFKAYAQTYSDNCVLLVDTYDTLKSGIPNAIRIFDELKPAKKGIRIDSGDITYLTKKARKMLDDAGHPDATIVISNSLDEYIIKDILLQGACIDSFGVGERLITSKAEPVFGGVYKLCAVEKEDGTIIPKIKISNNIEKVTNPGYKKVYRLFDKDTGYAFGDYMCLADEPVPGEENLKAVSTTSAKKFKELYNYEAKPLLQEIYRGGELVYEQPDLAAIRKNRESCLEHIWEECLRFENPHIYNVYLSMKLYDLKNELLGNNR
ncbi:MAG: nicotinate phosphoribosyltransferase [Firmicutes bacterium]|nr:nicotinate phosphoribosyltransferase [Bacillota bacterium]